jgi:hypothetical protein
MVAAKVLFLTTREAFENAVPRRAITTSIHPDRLK